MEYKEGDSIFRKDLNFFEKYVTMADWCNSSNGMYIIQEDEDRGTYTIVKTPKQGDTQEDKLKRELSSLHAWFSRYSYIAEKIAYGRATREEYADIISQMDAKAERINQIRAELKAMGR